METTFYDDPIMLRNEKNNQQSLKRPVTLNLESPGTTAKRQRFNPILTSPDLKMLQLASPELERIIISNGNIITPSTPLQCSDVTEEQEQYARGFIDALNQLHQNGKFDFTSNNIFQHISTGLTPLFANPPELVTTTTSTAKTPSSVANQNKQYNTLVPLMFQPATSSPTSVIKSLGSAKSVSNPAPKVRPPSVENFSSNSCSSSSSLPLPLDHITIKEELQTVPSDYSSPPLSPIYKGPIDMENQERIKLERKRQRNRIAASKCRKRKLEKISQLEYKVKELKGENSKLETIAEKLRSEICALKENVLAHVKEGCRIQRPHFN